ncbi:hypothetical protein BGZ96_002832 [Linnemannia gamsii]|uniref:Tc toxin complex TcA C-terminal TcB-binding domain-containing protein n=1 Tax=Linnemannia gamsii TaxID=64522 RepID=A0ABQ7K8C8_9FUNG|nr:hypothetical protein BGZ96_002832 [Linnemannia gamsii]
MYNLRHNLTLDGKPLSLPLYDAPINPRELLAQRGRNGTLNGNESSHELDIPPYRFRAILPRAYTAVEMLCYFGNMLLSALERKEHAAQEELQQAQLLDLSSYTLTLQQQAVDMARASQAALQVGKAAAQQRYDHYKQLYDENISNSEQIVGGLRGAAQIALAATQPLQIASGAASLVPNIFGLSDGGSKWGAPLFALAIEGQIWSDGLTFSADIIAESEQYRRRREEWEIQYKQAQSEMNVIDKQMETQALQIQAAQTTLQQTKAQQAQVQAMHVFLKTRFTQASLYQWLVSQLSVLYYQAYDAVLSLCLGTQACWRYERGDFETNFIQTSAWNDSYRGLLVGETLKLNLQQMEAAYLNRDERRLEITHTVSLKQMFGEAKWESNLTTLRSDGSLEFELKERHFSERYPGHYLRQIVAVTVTLPASVGPYQDIRATLTQNSSKFTTRADLNAVESLLDETKSSFTDIKNVKTNLRASQQVALSSGLDDSGLFVLNFGDERYLPFEGTGVVSSWQLTFPRPDAPDQKKMLETLTDVIVRIRYTACDGGEEFAKQVERELTKAVKR